MRVSVHYAREVILAETSRAWERLPEVDRQEFMKNGRPPSTEAFLSWVLKEISKQSEKGRQYERQFKLAIMK